MARVQQARTATPVRLAVTRTRRAAHLQAGCTERFRSCLVAAKTLRLVPLLWLHAAMGGCHRGSDEWGLLLHWCAQALRGCGMRIELLGNCNPLFGVWLLLLVKALLQAMLLLQYVR